MRYFHGFGPEAWSSKYNFVDEDNVVIGYDASQKCWERASWFIASELQSGLKGEHMTQEDSADSFDWEPWSIDPAFFNTFEVTLDPDGEDSTSMVAFRLTSEGQEPIYLHLFNSHNGYYSHGFTVEVGGETTRKGGL